ncbi:MAG: alpha/beta fold hydrolase [Rhizobiales bacterium]|jgi:dienelactone hydrolase|nr:alpha/beta fold hydrolase [Hyphomicrobiales bacterium]
MALKTQFSLRGRLRSSAWVLLVASAAFVAGCIAVLLFQKELIFPNAAEGPMDRPPPPNAKRIWLTAEDGSRVEGWWFPPKRTPAPAVLFIHGNSDYIETRIEYGDFYQREGYGALLMEYRGYRRSTGEPSETVLRRDALAFYDWLTENTEVDQSRISIHGASLGGAIAAFVATQRPVQALILQGAFTSLPDMFWRYGVPGFLAQYDFDTERMLRAGRGPVLILHGEDDEIVPFEHAKRLQAAAGDDACLSVIASADHDLPLDWNSFGAEIDAFLQAPGAAAGAAISSCKVRRSPADIRDADHVQQSAHRRRE